jgi:hypothetical protein
MSLAIALTAKLPISCIVAAAPIFSTANPMFLLKILAAREVH